MSSTVEVRFKGIRKDYYRWRAGAPPPRLDAPVIVEAEASALRSVVRVATEQDARQATDLRRGEDDVRRRVSERAQSHGLAMKISDAEWQWDRKKLTVYFTAEQRVDFRALVRELAAQYHTRIELRQIGARDEAARLGGVGRCGREYCCSTWLTTLSPVSLSLAKHQHLSLNPTQISGGCGRLLCCLRYEHDFYLAQRKRFPKEGKSIRTGRGMERVTAVDIFRERVFLRSDEHGHRTVALVDLQTELESAADGAGTSSPDRTGTRRDRSTPKAAAKVEANDQQDAPGAEPPRPAGAETRPPGRSRRRRRRGKRKGPGGGGGGGGDRGGQPGPGPS